MHVSRLNARWSNSTAIPHASLSSDRTENGRTSSERTWPGLCVCFVVGIVPNAVLFCLRSKKFDLHIFVYPCLEIKEFQMWHIFCFLRKNDCKELKTANQQLGVQRKVGSVGIIATRGEVVFLSFLTLSFPHMIPVFSSTPSGWEVQIPSGLPSTYCRADWLTDTTQWLTLFRAPVYKGAWLSKTFKICNLSVGIWNKDVPEVGRRTHHVRI
jgi:hypothetical protein